MTASGGVPASGGTLEAGAAGSSGAGGEVQPPEHGGAGGISGAAGSTGSGTVPSGWTCEAFNYLDGYCDCGCGAIDADCAASTSDVCDYCLTAFGSCGYWGCANIDPDNNAVCTAQGAPAEWLCPERAYGNGECDCGCGVLDVDCPSSSKGDCEACGDQDGSCSDEFCANIHPTDNAICFELPSEWTCRPFWYSDDKCDCGCGAYDEFGCKGHESSRCDFCDDEGACSQSCEDVDPDQNWLCQE